MSRKRDSIRDNVFHCLLEMGISGADAEEVERVACEKLLEDLVLVLCDWDKPMLHGSRYSWLLYTSVFQAIDKLYLLVKRNRPTITEHFTQELIKYGFVDGQIDILLDYTKTAIAKEAPGVPISWNVMFVDKLTREQYLAITIKMGILISKLRMEGKI